ncbi:hypothetical protein ACFL6C_09160 [Myxococcota bacterium]
MQIELHPDAERNLDEKAIQLRENLGRNPPRPARAEFDPDRPVSVAFGAEDILNVGDVIYPDHAGEPTARFRPSHDGPVGLSGDAYRSLHEFAARTARAGGLRDKVSVEFVEATLFDWLVGESDGPAAAHLLAAAAAAIRPHTIMLPIQHFYPQRPFDCGRVRFEIFDREFFSGWRAACSKVSDDPSTREILQTMVEDNQKKMQGLGAARVDIDAEPKYAKDWAVKETERSLAVLRFFAPANVIPTQTCFCTPLGMRPIPKQTLLVAPAGGQAWGPHEGFAAAPPHSWNLSSDSLGQFWAAGLGRLSSLLGAEASSEFEKAVLDACLLFSRACLVPDLHERLVYQFAAIESLVLEGESDPIIVKVADSMAFVLGRNVEERRGVARTVRETYRLRSAFVHHGYELSDHTKVVEFSGLAWRFMLVLVSTSAEHETRRAFLEALETKKYS